MDYSRYFKYKHVSSDDAENDNVISEDTETPERQSNRRIKSLMYVLIFGLLIILYVSNVIQVKKMLKEVYQLDKKSEKIIDGNQLLNLRINQLESSERITTIAKEKFGMIKPVQPPMSLPSVNDSVK